MEHTEWEARNPEKLESKEQLARDNRVKEVSEEERKAGIESNVLMANREGKKFQLIFDCNVVKTIA